MKQQTNAKLEEVVQMIEEATALYEEIIKKMDLTNQNVENTLPSSKSLRVLVNDKRTVLDPSVKFEDIKDPSPLDSPLPSGHMVTSFYYRNPNQTNPSYQTEPVLLKPWLSYRALK
ncbi:hypothetical protein [Halalkalibacter alkalisediminis]|uniref:Uncharacterized protein n=1 Tax=Halalkalibacter alkalisediminis TaxID=935616 RepID=A0ABV6NA78_9BACI|nr:hypothetical protein [Halalkalibacter alkalisediminis]